MSTRNFNWYNLQSTRQYPLDENASGVDDAGKHLPSNILVDANIRFPETAGRFAWIGGVTVTDNLVTVTILGADSPTAAAAFTPIAAVTLQKPVDEFRHYAVTPLQPGVGGHVVFSEGTLENGSWRFASPTQSLLAPKVARPYTLPPVTSLGKQFSSVALTGVVTIEGAGDVEVVRDVLFMDNAVREVLVVRLKQATPENDPLATYVGPCQRRPESRNCRREPIETINGVRPDCDGNIEIVFKGLAAGVFEDCGGLVIDLDLPLASICSEVAPREDFADQCESLLDSCSSFSYILAENG